MNLYSYFQAVNNKEVTVIYSIIYCGPNLKSDMEN